MHKMRRNARGSLAKRGVARRAIMTSFGALAALSFDFSKGSFLHTLLAHRRVYFPSVPFFSRSFSSPFFVSPPSPSLSILARTYAPTKIFFFLLLSSFFLPLSEKRTREVCHFRSPKRRPVPPSRTIITIPPAHLLETLTTGPSSEHGPTHILIFITRPNKPHLRMCALPFFFLH